ncbi:hypothetical protein ACLMJK_006872 [Lecanora helva]
MSDPATPSLLPALSSTFSWSLSFYPQPYLNYTRKSTTGTTPSFPILNILGFTCLSLSTISFYYSPLIRSQYRARNHGLENTARFNDVMFAVHALGMSWITVSQFFWARVWGFEKRRVRVDKVIWGIVIGSFVGLGVAVVMVVVKGKDGGQDPDMWAWIDVVYGFGAVKLLVTLIKYIPQVWTNYQRQSTVGWSIYQILMDFIGGILSIAQLVLDSSVQSDWSGVTGNPVKFGLGQISILFDVIFMVQHYVLYRDARRVDEVVGESERRLLGSDEEDGFTERRT